MSEISRGRSANRYVQIIERIFESHYEPGMDEVIFEREEIINIAKALGISLPKNLGDIIYSFRYRATLPDTILSKAPPGKTWNIHPAGRSRYRFVAEEPIEIIPNSMLAETKIP